ncbi:polar amino acid transport system permease protein [Tamaricihabitans halophyticus]|uniref:Polar amino acid transport system permease protein n=1 Tax=Tamaricihabitans halophyticus TaxID=1262583 RepID=A0A4R2QH98_9PSEU|nr:ectoine/hydroxyectoine ABC transporter permease subunit EhuC [Tamaricihabitans halophyticus]TCP47964.1 polar amino acid transport system permease protein [Tamaricihabitans halophyticus]
MDAVAAFLPYFFQGIWVTLQIFVLGLALALVVAFLTGLGRMSPVRLIRWPCAVFIEVFRGTSAIVQLFWFFYALPLFLDIRLSPLLAGVLVLGLNQGSYAAEVVRGAVQSVPRTQWEAATALNMPKGTTLRKVILPQAFVGMLPPLGNVAIDLMKNTSLVSLVTVLDLTYRAQLIRATTGETTIIFGILVVVYLILTNAISLLRRTLERRMPAGLAYAPGKE